MRDPTMVYAFQRMSLLSVSGIPIFCLFLNQGYASGSFGPTTAGRMDSYVEEFQAAGGSMVMLAKGNRSKAVSTVKLINMFVSSTKLFRCTYWYFHVCIESPGPTFL
mgnify:FL=1